MGCQLLQFCPVITNWFLIFRFAYHHLYQLVHFRLIGLKIFKYPPTTVLSVMMSWINRSPPPAWRHNQVLRQIALGVNARCVIHNNQVRREEKKIEFVKAGEKRALSHNRVPSSFLDGAKDWKLMVDLGGNLKVPRQIADTNQRPDMMLISESTRLAGVIELTIPREDRIEVPGERKKLRYAPLREQGKANGWKVHVRAVEVGCRGFP